MMKFPFEAHVVDAERGGTVRIVVDETGEVVLKDCYGDIVLDIETALIVADHVVRAAELREEARKKRLTDDGEE